MSAEAPALVHTFRVGHRTCTITLPMPKLGSVSYVAVEWEPDLPAGLSRSDRRQYQKGRDKAFAEFGRRFDLDVTKTVEF